MTKDEKDDNNKAKSVIIDTTVSVVDAAVSLFIPLSPFTIMKSFATAYSTIKEQNFKKRLLLFLSQDQENTEADKEAFKAKLANESESFFNTLFTIIDRLDDEKKAIVIGRLFKNLLKERITIKEFLKLSSIIDNTFIDSLEYIQRKSAENANTVRSIYQEFGGGEVISKHLCSIGLMVEDVEIKDVDQSRMRLDSKPKPVMKSRFYLTPLGETLVRFGFEMTLRPGPF